MVTPVYGEFVPTSILTSVYNTSAGSIVPGSAPASSEGAANGDGVIHDITGTTVYVVAVICVIPVAGLVAWVVRYVVKKKVNYKKDVPMWRCRGSNPGPFTCKANALPLRYIP